MLIIEGKPSEVFITNLKELLGYQEFFFLRKTTQLGKSGKSVRVVISHETKEHITSHKCKLIKDGLKIEKDLIDNLAYIFEFKWRVTNYYSPTKISHVIYFMELKFRQLKYSELYSEFKNFIKETSKDSEFKILQYRQINNTIHVVFEHPLSYNTLFPEILMNDIKKKFLMSYFIKLKGKFLFNASRLKEVISKQSIFYVYRIQLLRMKYSFSELGICKESKHLLIKYIKMLSLAWDYIMRDHNWSNSFVYLELGTSSPTSHLRSIFYQIKEEREFCTDLLLGRDKTIQSEGDLWVPRKRELKNILFGDILDRQTVTLLKHSKYQEWRKKHKISIKCEELNLLAYYMETEHNLFWDKKNKWRPKLPPPKKVFKINDYLTLKLEEDHTNIYVKGKLFNHCKYLLFSFSKDELSEYEEIDSIDEIKNKYDRSHESDHSKISPEVEFWGHCSNLQVWYEYDYDTRILHSNLAFPLLEELSKQGDPIAKKVFKDEIAIRFESNFDTVIKFLLARKYLEYLDLKEIEILNKNLDFSKWYSLTISEFYRQWISKVAQSNDLTLVKRLQVKREDLLEEKAIQELKLKLKYH
ncbi:MAG: hypothetical protein ACFFDF_12045 [Candidatus Odinarchaeota archaeon]